jgi:hypothetical protein
MIVLHAMVEDIPFAVARHLTPHTANTINPAQIPFNHPYHSKANHWAPSFCTTRVGAGETRQAYLPRQPSIFLAANNSGTTGEQHCATSHFGEPCPIELQWLRHAGSTAAPDSISKKHSKKAAKLREAFAQAFTTIYDVHNNIASDRSSDGCLSNEELAQVHAAYKTLHAAMNAAAVELLFGQVEESVMQSFFRSCMEQARTGVGARHSSLHGEVCPFLFSWAKLDPLQAGVICTCNVGALALLG